MAEGGSAAFADAATPEGPPAKRRCTAEDLETGQCGEGRGGSSRVAAQMAAAEGHARGGPAGMGNGLQRSKGVKHGRHGSPRPGAKAEDKVCIVGLLECLRVGEF